MFDYRGAIAVVTGASSGLGRRMALDLVERGATVLAVARREHLLPAEATERLGCDLTDLDGWAAALADVEERHGRIDVLVNAAGVERRQGIETLAWRDVEEALTVNYRAAALATLTVVPGMLDRGRGAVLNVSSDHGRAPGPGTPAYCASKAALSAFTESVAHEVRGRGVHLHVLYPGWVPTALGQGAVDAGMPKPPRAVRRSEEAVSRLALDRLGGRSFEVNAARLATFAPVVRALLPPVYRRSMGRVG